MDKQPKFKINTTLHTKNGKTHGNGIIISITFKHNDIYYTVKTDYGNLMTLNEAELHEYFTIGKVSTSHKYAKREFIKFEGTPGDWTVPHFASSTTPCNCGFVLAESLEGAVATVHFTTDNEHVLGSDPQLKEAQANARLIAHAPQLFNTIQKLMDIGVFQGESGGNIIEYTKELLNEISKTE